MTLKQLKSSTTTKKKLKPSHIALQKRWTFSELEFVEILFCLILFKFDLIR